MKIDKALLLFGKPIELHNLGHVKSPKLSEVLSGFDLYASFSLARAVTSSDKDGIREIIKGLALADDYSDMTDLDFDEASKFQLISHSRVFRELFRMSLELFFVEDVVWMDEYACYAIQDGSGNIVGVVSNDNYGIVETILSQLSGDVSGSDDEIKFASPEAKRLWEAHNNFEKAELKTGSMDYSLPNIISKLACGTTGYTLFSIFDLTVYQLFDQFQAYCQCRSSALNENAYAHWGGEDFDPLAWLRSQQS